VTAPSYHVVLNARSGTAAQAGVTPERLRELFAAANLPVEIDADMERPLSERIAKAVASRAEVIVAAGGDGTITAVATALAGTRKTLAFLPLGTANLLARDLRVPLDIEAAVAALGEMTPRRIDVAEVNGRVFLHKAVLGLAPALAVERERLRERFGLRERIGFLFLFLKRLTRPRNLAVLLRPEGKPVVRVRARAIAVGNNSYDEGLGLFFSRSRLDGGRLTIYALSRLDLFDFVRLVIGMALGRWRDDETLTISEARHVVIASRRRLLHVMVDGEVEKLRPPLRFRIRPLALSVLAPAAEPASEPGVEPVPEPAR